MPESLGNVGDSTKEKTSREIAEQATSATTKEESPAIKLQKSLKDYPFITFENGKFKITHTELTEYLSPKILKVGDLSKKGVIQANLNGGASNVDGETDALNGFIATILVGFENLPKDFEPFNVEDTALIKGLYLAVRSYQQFFRKSPIQSII